MALNKWCGQCGRNITEKKDFNWLASWATCLLFYSVYYFFLKRPICPICNNEFLEPPRVGESNFNSNYSSNRPSNEMPMNNNYNQRDQYQNYSQQPSQQSQQRPQLDFSDFE